METFRVEVGRMHDIQPGNLVGAIANEAGIAGSAIGRIEIYDDYSTVDLPVGMPKELFFALKKVRVAGRPLAIRRWRQGGAGAPPFVPGEGAGPPRRERRFGDRGPKPRFPRQMDAAER